MKGRVVALLEEPGRPAMAALSDRGRLLDLFVDPPEDDPAPRVEEIRAARVTRKAGGMGAVFLDIGDGAEGFLKGAGARDLAPGDRLLVQVTRHAEGAKAVPVTDEPLYKGRYAILTPHAPGVNVSRRIRDEEEAARLKGAAEAALAEAGVASGAILRTLAEGVPDETVFDDVAALAALLAEARAAPEAPGLVVAAPDAETRAWREWAEPEPDEVIRGDARLWDDLGLWDAIAALFDARAPLAGGAWMPIEPTSALVAVDVNTGGDLSPAAGLKADLAALEALPRQLLLRGLGGQIVVDLAPVGKRERPRLETALKRALRDDPVETQIIGWTPLGHLELTRARERRPLTQLMARP